MTEPHNNPDNPDESESAATVDTPPTADEPPSTAELLQKLAAADVDTRLVAVQALANLPSPPPEALRALEKTAGQDSSDAVRRAALQALTQPAYRQTQRQSNRLSASVRQLILTEIERWQADGLLPGQAINLLKQRYLFEAPLETATAPAAAASPAADPKPKPTLSQLLLSETTIKVALYLGAFFVLAAAFILAAVIEFLRLPILGIATASFLVVGLALKRRLPQASFVLFVIFTFLLPIDAGVLLDMIGPVSRPTEQIYWIAVALLLALVWVGGTALYTSRFFSMAALLALTSAALQTGRWLDFSFHLDLFLIGLVTLLGLGTAFLLRRWQNQTFSLPLLWLSQLQIVCVLAVSSVMVLVALFDDSLTGSGWWLAIGALWLLGVLFYHISYRFTPFPLFPWLATAALLPVPLLWLQTFDPPLLATAGLTCVWGVLLALAGEGIPRLSLAWLRPYALPLSLGALALLTLAPLLGFADRVWVGLVCLMVASLLYGGLTAYQPRWWTWSAALLAGVAAYFAIFFLPGVRRYQFYPGFVMLWPTLALPVINLAARRLLDSTRRWHLPPLLLGLALAGLTLLVLLATGLDEYPGRATFAFAIISGYLALFAILDQRPWLGYGATTSLALALGYVLLYSLEETWITPFIVLATLYVAGGFALKWTLPANLQAWANMLRWSGLILGALVSLTAPLQGGAAAVIGSALAATYIAVEAYDRRNIWLGFPSALLYLLAYFTLLIELEVTEPQVYSIGAALLGFIMHYLLVRSGNSLAAFLTGLTSQLILLSTTYIQMVATDRFLFFFVLFIQSLVVLVYGLVVRSRSLVGAPLLFVVLGVITVTLSVLAGIPALILVGCTGLLLLILGIIALLQRERLLTVTSQLSERLGGWQA